MKHKYNPNLRMISESTNKKGGSKGLPPTFPKSGGFTLTETTIVIAIFGLIIAIVYLIFILNQRVYSAGEEMAEITQNGRVILERMTREIRQAKEIVTELPEERIDPSNEIIFQDGHLFLVSEEGAPVSPFLSSSITLASTASTIDNYYKDIFIKIIEGAGEGQVKKIISYDGGTKTAEIETDWDPTGIPDGSSTYKIDTYYYYIRYYRDNNYILREIFTYCRSDDSINCASPEIYVPWDASPSPVEITLEVPRIIGEYLTDLEFWGSEIINIALTLKKKDKTVDFQTKIFGRNL